MQTVNIIMQYLSPGTLAEHLGARRAASGWQSLDQVIADGARPGAAQTNHMKPPIHSQPAIKGSRVGALQQCFWLAGSGEKAH